MTSFRSFRLALSVPRLALALALLVLTAPRAASAEDLFVYIVNPGRAVASKAGGAAGAVLSLAGQASKAATNGSAPLVEQGFADRGVTATAAPGLWQVYEPLYCAAKDYNGQMFTAELPPGRYWMLSVHTEGFFGWLGKVTGGSTEGLLDSFLEKGVYAAVCPQTP